MRSKSGTGAVAYGGVERKTCPTVRLQDSLNAVIRGTYQGLRCQSSSLSPLDIVRKAGGKKIEVLIERDRQLSPLAPKSRRLDWLPVNGRSICAPYLAFQRFFWAKAAAIKIEINSIIKEVRWLKVTSHFGRWTRERRYICASGRSRIQLNTDQGSPHREGTIRFSTWSVGFATVH